MAKPKDVVVIGAGPAGAAAATVCARAGLDVIVLTQEHRTAVRAVESLHAGVESVMDYLGAAEALRIACCSRYRGIWVNKEFVPLGQDPSGPWLGYHVDRRQLDSELCAAAVRSGAVIRYSSVRSASIERGRASTVILHSGELVPARWIIDASGYRCWGGRVMGFSEQRFSERLIAWSALRHDPAALQGFDGNPRFVTSGDRWQWFAHESSSRCSWTSLQRWTEASLKLGTAIETRAYARDVTWRLFRPVVSDGILLAGDAAGLLDPGAGQGVLFALLSGIRAGNAVVQSLQQPAFSAFVAADYDDWFLAQYTARATELRSHYTALGIRATGAP